MANSADLYARLSNFRAPYNERLPLGDLEKLVRRRNYREFIRHFKALFTTARTQNLSMFRGEEQKYFTEVFSLW
ncbi:MAG: hypothetical protein LIP77_08120, partial [Planctomycetes bacterium]|nr:hypothetical protein [Planctomycetota bacterium]